MVTVKWRPLSIMDQAEAVRVFEQYLSVARIAYQDLDCLAWFCDDFDLYAQNFVEVIGNKIRVSSDHNAIKYYELINHICRKRDACLRYVEAFGEVLPKFFEISMSSGDITLRAALNEFWRKWAEDGVFGPDVLQALQGALRSITPARPVPAPQPFIPAPMPVAPVYVQAPTPIHTPAPAQPASMEGRRLARGWMRTALQWEDPEDASNLIIDIDEQDEEAGDGQLLWVPVDSTNDKVVRCKACGGILEKGTAPNGVDAYLGVIWTGTAYYHRDCHDQKSQKSNWAKLFTSV